MEVWLNEEVSGQIVAAGGEAPVEFVAVHRIQLGGRVITLSIAGEREYIHSFVPFYSNCGWRIWAQD